MKKIRKISLLVLSIIIVALLSIAVNILASEEEAVIKPEITAENYTVYITEADSISSIRFAKGEYTTSAEIKAASDCVSLSSSVIKANTQNGVMSYEMADGGIYSFWVKTVNGAQYIYSSVDVTRMTPEVSADGTRITISNFYGAYDLFIAKGVHTSYQEVKANGYIVRVKDKLAGLKTYSYSVADEGEYTVLIRYNDREWYKSFTIEVTHPTFEENGLQLTVGNLEGVKVIRTAYGEHSSVSSIKKADTHRAFTAKNINNELKNYTIQYRQNGKATVVVQFENGYCEFYSFDVTKKIPTLVQNSSTVTFGDLEGLKVLRYARGEYHTSYEIKNAPDSKYLRADSITDGKISLTLETGTYSFLVQYTDESYNYYILSVGENSVGEFSKCNSFTDEKGNTVSSLPYWLYTPANATSDMPLIVVLHSAHVKANTSLDWQTNLDSMMTTKYSDLPKFIYNGEFGEIPAYIVMPQTDGSSRGWSKRGAEITELVKYCEREFKTNCDNVSIIGYSLGGTGALELASAYPDIFDRVLSVAGGLDGVTNNTRPYIQGVGRLALSDSYYPSLRIETASGYAKEIMKYQYAAQGNSALAQTDEEKSQAADFEEERINDVSCALRDAKISVWAIVGSLDTEVAPIVSEKLCAAVGSSARFDSHEGYSHSKAPSYCLEVKEAVLEFLLNDQ